MCFLCGIYKKIMKRTVAAIFLIIIIYSCRQSVNQFAVKTVNADSIAINYFTGDGKMDTVTSVKIIRDKDKINQLAKMISGYTTGAFKCGSDGSIHFFKNNAVIQDVYFRMNDVQCMHFSFMLEGKMYNTELNPEGRQLLEGLKK